MPDAVDLDAVADIVEYRFADGESRWLVDDEKPFDPAEEGVVRIRIAERAGIPRGPGLSTDSSVTLRMPDLDVDSEVVHDLRLEFLSGPDPLVLVWGEGKLTRESLFYLVDVVVEAVGEVERNEGPASSMADRVDYLGLWVLRRRLERIQRSVREALGDERFTADDLTALQAYPERLAKVEEAARAVRSLWPEVKLPSSGSGGFLAPRISIAPNPFGEHVDKISQDAKDAVARLSGLISSQQVVLTQRQAQETSRFQRIVTIVGATVLVPGLIAAVFGADVGFHGRDTTGAFWAMLLLMAGGAVATYALLRSFETGAWRGLRKTRVAGWIARRSPTARLAALGAIGAVLLASGMYVLLDGTGSPQGSETTKAKDNGGQTDTATPKRVDPAAPK
jgi:hypothetical protein